MLWCEVSLDRNRGSRCNTSCFSFVARRRIALRSHYRLHAEADGEIPSFRVLTRYEDEPDSGWEASMRDKPVTLANAFGAATLFIIGYLWR